MIRCLVLIATLATVACRPPPTRPANDESSRAALAELEASVGGRLGVFALDLQTERELGYRADERFAVCSTFKWVLGAQVLELVDRGELALDEQVSFAPSDVLEYAPVVREHASEASLSVALLAEGAVVLSDNSAANLLLAKVDGPAGLTTFVRRLGDDTTRLDRTEPSLNENLPGDPRDTTSPRAMVGLGRTLLWGSALSASSRERLLGWLMASPTGKRRIRAGLPAAWKAGDKTGTCNESTANDVAIIWPPGRKPILLAVYLSEGRAELARLEAIHARVAELTVREFSE